MNKNKLSKIFKDNFRLYQRCMNQEAFDLCNEIYKIAQANSIAVEFCFTLSHIIVKCVQATNINYNIYDVMCDYFNVMQSYLYENYVMTAADWESFVSEIKKVYAKYQSSYVSDLGIAIINLYEKEQNKIQLSNLRENKKTVQLSADESYVKVA